MSKRGAAGDAGGVEREDMERAVRRVRGRRRERMVALRWVLFCRKRYPCVFNGSRGGGGGVTASGRGRDTGRRGAGREGGVSLDYTEIQSGYGYSVLTRLVGPVVTGTSK